MTSQPTAGQLGGKLRHALVDLDQQHLAHLGEAGYRVGTEQLAPVDHDKLGRALEERFLTQRIDATADAEVVAAAPERLRPLGLQERPFFC